MASEFNSKCRTCLSESNNYHQLHDYVEEHKVLEMLDGIVPQIDIKASTRFSTLMCQTCVDKLLISYTFQQLCIESNNRLHDSLNIAVFESKTEMTVNPMSASPSIQIKREIENVSPECEIALNELDGGTQTDNDNRVPDDDEIDTDSSDEQLSTLKKRLAKQIPLTNKNFENSNKQHAPVLGTVCTICDKDFRFNSKLKEHMRKHSGESPYQCTQCDKSFRRALGLKYHILIHSGEKPYACSECGKTFRHISYLREHMARHSGVKKFQCPDCPSGFYRRSDLIRHCKSEKVHLNIGHLLKPNTQHEVPDYLDIQRINDSKVEEVDGEYQKLLGLQCPDCPERFENESLLLAHYKMHKKTDFIEADMQGSDEDGEVIKRVQTVMAKEQIEIFKESMTALDNDNSESKRKKDEYHPCETCGKVFEKVFLLKRHSSVHSLMRPHKCEICKYRFASAKNLKAHLSKHKNGTLKNFKYLNRRKDKIKPLCSICGKEFANNYNLKEHMRLHSGEKPFQCAQCGKTFRYSSALKEHMRRHSGENPYKCPHCGKTFRYSSSFNRHKDKHTGLKKYYCPECPSRFKYRSDLISHRTKLHLKDVNLKKSQLSQHENKSAYSCEICNTILTSNKTLEDHMLTHTSDEFAMQRYVQQNECSIEKNDFSEIFEIKEFLEEPTINDKEGEEEYGEDRKDKVHMKLLGMQDALKEKKRNDTMECVSQVVVKEEVEVASQIFEVYMDADSQEQQESAIEFGEQAERINSAYAGSDD